MTNSTIHGQSGQFTAQPRETFDDPSAGKTGKSEVIAARAVHDWW
jgi:cell division protein FtsI/penicillin-binding protein 2